MIVHLKRAVQFERFAREQKIVAGAIDHHRIRLAQSFPGAEQHFARRADERRIVDAHDRGLGEIAFRRARDRLALEKAHGIVHTRHAPDAEEIGVLQRLGLLEILGCRIHHPNLGVGDVGDLAACAAHDAGEDAGLILEQERAERDGENQTEVFGPVTGEHAEGDEVHRTRGYD